MTEFRLTATVVVYDPHNMNDSIWLEKELVLPFCPVDGLSIIVGTDPDDKSGFEYHVRDLSWDMEQSRFWSLYQDSVHEDGHEAVEAGVEVWKKMGWTQLPPCVSHPKPTLVPSTP